MLAPRRRSALALALLAAAVPGARLAAQPATQATAGRGTAVVTGTVRAQAGRPLAGALVGFRAGGTDAGAGAVAPSTQTDAEGRFRLEVPAGVAGDLVVRRAGSSESVRPLGTLAAGSRREIGVTLAPLARLDVVTVIAERDRPLLNTQDAAVGGAIGRRELQALPTDARDPITLAYTIPGVAQATAFFGDAPRLTLNGANALYTQYSIDGLENNEGFLGGPRVEVPLSALARLDVLANTYSSEFGRSSNGVVNLETRAGGERWTGEAFVYRRPGGRFDARPALVPPGENRQDFLRARDGFRRTQVGGAGGGPLARARADGSGTYAFGAVEYTNENEQRINSTASATFLGRELREIWKLFGRVDHGWSPTQTTTLRVAASTTNRAGEGTGIIAPEADVTVRRVGSVSALTHRSALRGGRASNVASAQLGTFRWHFPPTQSSFDVPQVTISRVVAPGDTAAVGIVGSSNFIFDERELQLQLKNVFETSLGTAHQLRLGADAFRSGFRLTGSQTNPSGAYVVLDEGNIPRQADGRYRYQDVPASVRVLSYTVDAAQKQVDLTQTLVGAFVEDRWRPTASLTVNLGLRWDYDDLTSRGASRPDLNNFQPRASVNWLATPQDVVRGGAGVYTGKFPYAIYSDAIQFGPDGNQTVVFRGAQAPAFGQGPRTATLDRSTLPPGEVRELFALGLQQPTSYQYTLGYQRQLGARASIAVDGVLADTRNLPRSWDLNASARTIAPADTVTLPVSVGDQTRPVQPVTGGFRRRTTSESGGRATYRALFTVARYQATNALLLDANWTWSRARNNTEDINFNATQGNRFDLEWADAINDRRHKVTGRATYTGVRDLLLAGVVDFQTGQPLNRVAFFRDLDGSGDTFGNGFLGNQDRFAGVPRNGERLPSAFLVNATVGWRVPVAATAGRGLELRADLFNVFNRANYSGVQNGIPGGGSRTQVGRPGDRVVFSNVGAPRQLQLSARYAL
jgi:hypothetical protein